MSRRAVYKTYQEENGEVKLDLTVTFDGKYYEVSEVVHLVNITKLSSDELNMVLSELDLPESVKLEIKKSVLNKQFGLLENTKQKFDELIPRVRDDADFVRDNIEYEYNQFEKRIKKEIEEFNEKFDKFKDYF